MEIEILGVEYHNIRNFEDLTIDFVNGKDVTSDISLLLMPNGTGKTTSKTLIANTLTGYEYTESEISTFKPNYPDNVRNGKFALTLRLKDMGDEEIPKVKIIVEFDYQYKKYKYLTSTIKKEGGGLDEGYHLPAKYRNIVNRDFIKFFVFDGELANDFLNKEAGDAEVALKSMYLLDRVLDLRNDIEKILKKRKKETELTKVKTSRGLAGKENKLEKYEKQLAELDAKLEQYKALKRKKKRDLEYKKELKKSNDVVDPSIIQQLTDIEKEMTKIENQIDEKTRQYIHSIRQPGQYSEKINTELRELMKHMIHLKLPISMSKEFFVEIFEQDKGICICGTELNQEMKNYIKSNYEKYLTSDQIAVLNAVKMSVKDMSPYEDKGVIIEDINDLEEEYLVLNRKKIKLEAKIKNIDIGLYEEIVEDINTLKNEIREIEEVIHLMTVKDTRAARDLNLDAESNIPICQKKVDDLALEIAEATNTVESFKKGKLLEDILEDIVSEAIGTIKGDLISRVNQKLEFWPEIEVHDITNRIVLANEENDQAAASEGQKLATSYAYIATLFEESPHQLPFILDSPTGKLDTKVRQEVAYFLSKGDLFTQLILFIIDVEREGFVENLDSTKDINYSTIYRESQNQSIVKVDGKSFFDEFQTGDA